MDKPLLILGGYGNAGRWIARLLLQESSARLILAGRNLERATAQAEALNQEFATDRVSAQRADAADRASLVAAFQQAKLVVVASSTSHYAETVARAAIEVGIDALDLQYSTAKVRTLQAMEEEIRRAGRCFITDGGFHPGLPAALVRYAAQEFDRLETANVSSVIRIDWAALSVSAATIEELAGELLDFQMLSYRQGRWQKAGWTTYRKFEFDPPFGQQPCAPMLLEEMRALPEMIPTLRETGFYVGGFNRFVDWIVMPIGLVALKLWPQQALKPVGRFMAWGLRTFSSPPYGTVLQLEASGQKEGQPAAMRLTVSHEDGYVLTAVPVVACLLQYLDGQIGQPGLWFQAHVVDPRRLLVDMERMGVAVQVSIRQGNSAGQRSH